jgi:hypothetical protein
MCWQDIARTWFVLPRVGFAGVSGVLAFSSDVKNLKNILLLLVQVIISIFYLIILKI